jgi:hypothetical protein
MKWRSVKPRTVAGVALTVVWLTGFGLLTLLWEPPKTGNEWGDWAAGMFAPVAFFWLVLGYFQQGEELRLQAEELRASVEQQSVLAKATSRQTHLLEKSQTISLRAQLMEHQPRFTGFVGHDPDQADCKLTIAIQNVGKTCFDCTVSVAPTLEGPHHNAKPLLPTWLHNEMPKFRMKLGPISFPAHRILTIAYRDELMVEQRQRWPLKMPDWPENGFHLVVQLDDHSFNLPPLLLPPTDGSIEFADSPRQRKP